MPASTRVPSLTCDGALIGRVWVPPFEVWPGELIKLAWESPELETAERVQNAMCETAATAPVRATGTVIPVELATALPAWRHWLHRERSADWLVRRTGADRREVDTRFRQLDLDPQAALSTLATTPRWLLGLEVAISQNPAVVTFQMAGLDPPGAQQALQAVAANIGQSAGVYLATHAELGIAEPDYTQVLPIRSRERQAVA